MERNAYANGTTVGLNGRIRQRSASAIAIANGRLRLRSRAAC
jgi:hypothetical protein